MTDSSMRSLSVALCLLMAAGCQRSAQPIAPPPPAMSGNMAPEVTLQSPDDVSWQELPGGIDWGVSFDHEVKHAPDQPVLLTVYLRNRRAEAQNMPVDFYRAPATGGPALRAGVRLHVEFAPFDPRSPHPHYPHHPPSFQTIEPKRHGVFDDHQKRMTLGPGEWTKAFELDVRDFGDISKPGHYTFSFSFDREQLGLPDEQTSGPAALVTVFDVGERPRQLSIAEINQSIPPLGDKDAEARLAALIRRTMPATRLATAPAARPAEPADFPPAVGGLTARIDIGHLSRWYGLHALVRFRNVSDRRVVIPPGNPPEGAFPYELHARRGDEEWRPVPRKTAEQPLGEDIKLEPGQTAVVHLHGWNFDSLRFASEVRVALRMNDAPTAAHWTGTLQTPARAPWTTEQLESAKGTLPFPDYFPPFRRIPSRRGGGLFIDPEENRWEQARLLRFDRSNWHLAVALRSYDPLGARREMERRMRQDDDRLSALYAASLAAWLGSPDAALRLLEALKESDFEHVVNAHAALKLALREFKTDPPEALVELAMAALSDQRYATGLEKTNFSRDTVLKLSYLADEEGGLTFMLGHLKCYAAVPLLKRMAGGTPPSRGAASALGVLRDERGMAVLMEALRKHESELNIWSGSLFPEPFCRAAAALGSLKCREALPILLNHLCHRDVIEAVEAIGDRSAVPALEGIVAAGKPQQIIGGGPESDQNALWAARIALATLKEGDPVPRWCELLHDQTLGEFARREVVFRLGDHPDPRAIPHLIQAIKTDSSGAVANQAIGVLSVYRHKEAVAGLIDCFDADFKGKADWKRAYTPEMFQENIAETLRTLTGQPLGPDKELWLKWWRNGGEAAFGGP